MLHIYKRCSYPNSAAVIGSDLGHMLVWKRLRFGLLMQTHFYNYAAEHIL